jgi:hypothetical protein
MRFLIIALAFQLFTCDPADFVDSSDVHPIDSTSMQTLTVRSARNGIPVVNAYVTIKDSTSHIRTTNRSGQVDMSDVSLGTRITIEAEGFLNPRIFLLRQDTEYLWEDDALLPGWYTKQIVYHDNEDGQLLRPNARVVTVVPMRSFLDEPRTNEAVHWAMNTMNGANSNIRYEVDTSNPENTQMKVEIVYEPMNIGCQENSGAGALAYNDYDGAVIVGGRIVFCHIEAFYDEHLQNAVLHELGHTRGMWHAQGGVMGSSDVQGGFSQREKKIMRFMFLRPPGNRWPDDSSSADAIVRSLSEESERTIERRLVCVVS